MKKRLICLLLVCGAVFCFARGKQEIIVSENFSTESKNVVVTVVNKTEADFQTLVITRKEVLSDKWELTDRRTFQVRSGESKSVVLDNQGLYKLELYDGKGHKFSKKNTFSQIIMDSKGNVISEGEFQQFTQSWQKLVFTQEDFEPQAVIDILEVFFGSYGNEKHETEPAKTCSVIIVNNTNEQIEYVSVVQDGIARTVNLAIDKSQCGVLDIKQSETADVSLISKNQRVFTKAGIVFADENLTVVFTAGDREVNAEKASSFVTSALGSISNVLSITTQVFSSALEKRTGEFEAATQSDGTAAATAPVTDSTDAASPDTDDAGTDVVSQAQAAEPAPKKSFWSWLPWVD